MYKYNVDALYRIGETHFKQGRPCQDHAAALHMDGAACAIVSDGCSTAGEDEAALTGDRSLRGQTDIGSRIVTSATAQALRTDWTTRHTTQPEAETLAGISARQQVLMGSVRENLGLPWYDLYATCLYAFVSAQGGFALVEGDGVVAWKLNNGSIVMHRYEWEDNTPYYPVYAQMGYQNFIAAHGGDLEALRATRNTWIYTPNSTAASLDETCEEQPEQEYTLREGISGLVLDLPSPSELSGVAVFSDGVTQINEYDWRKAVIGLLAFKSRRGPVATKRMTRFLRDCQKVGSMPLDDIAYSVILVDSVDEPSSNSETDPGAEAIAVQLTETTNEDSTED